MPGKQHAFLARDRRLIAAAHDVRQRHAHHLARGDLHQVDRHVAHVGDLAHRAAREVLAIAGSARLPLAADVDLLGTDGGPHCGTARAGHGPFGAYAAVELAAAYAHEVRTFITYLTLEQVHRADEVGDEARARRFVYVRRTAHLRDPAVVHYAETLAQGHRLLLVMCDDDERHAEALLDVEQFELRVLTQFLVERGQGFVEQQQLGTFHQRPRQCHPLPLAARQLMRLSWAEAPPLYYFQDLADLAADGIAPESLLLQAEADVLLHAHVREERVGLEHHVDRAFVRRDGAHVRAVDIDLAGSR